MFKVQRIRKIGELHPVQIIVLSFLSAILLGTFLLMLPQASTGEPLGFVNALFEATSAVCVTGLIVVDTGTRLTLFGQLVILALIQAGGLGIMTLSTIFLLIAGKKLSIRTRAIVQESLSQHPIKKLRQLMMHVFLFTFGIEFLGALFMLLRWLFSLPPKQALYYAIFHAISAFCNAGFSPFSESLMAYEGDVVINLVVTSLIITGGIGFYVLIDLRMAAAAKLSRRKSRLSFHTKVVLWTTLSLIIFGFLATFLLEIDNLLKDKPFLTKILAAYFQAVTPRTAGFNTLDTGRLTNATLMLVFILMFIGASPTSCGGGIKTTSFSIQLGAFWAALRGRERLELFKRFVSSEVVSRASAVTLTSLIVVLIGVMLLSITELGEHSHTEVRGSFLELTFEVISAFGTVGLSTGVTPKLSTLGRLIITFIMFIGRAGPLSMAIAIRPTGERRYEYAEENLMVG